MNDIIWVDPASIVHKISPVRALLGVKGGDWDIDHRHEYRATAKYRAIKARFIDRVDWLETDLFIDTYTRRLARDSRIGQARSLQELADIYEQRFAKLFEAMKRDGFRTESKSGRKFALPSFLIGRDGEVFIGNQGNHRLAIAQLLGLKKIAGRITCRHKLWML